MRDAHTEDTSGRSVLGNFSVGEGHVNEHHETASAPHRRRAPLTVRVSFEESRLAAAYLATAYEQVLPRPCRSVASAGHPPAAAGRPCSEAVARRGR